MSNSNSGGGFPLFGILGLIFVTLKLTGHIGWSWWWVTAPFWGPFAIAIPVAIFMAIGAATVARKTKGDPLASYRSRFN